MRCNIDAKGKRLRLISGLVVTATGLTLSALAALGALDGRWPWIVGTIAIVVGGFQIFEARAGWCAVRAMGIKTRI